MTIRHGQKGRIDAAVLAEITGFRGQHNHGDGLTAIEHARAHLAAKTPEERAKLHGEWL